MFVPFSFGFPVNISLGLNIGALLKGSCWDAELVAIPVDTGNRGTAFGTKLFGESFCFGQIKTFDPFFPCKPSDVFWSVTIVETWAVPVVRLQRKQWQR